MTDRDNEHAEGETMKRKRKRLYEPVSEENGTPSEKTGRDLPAAKTATASEHAARADHAKEIVRNYTLYSLGPAIVPLPLIDMAAILGIQLMMLKKLSDYYGMEFSQQRGKALIASLVGGVHAGLIAGSLLKLVPVLGLLGAIVPMAAVSGALTYAVGIVFVQHFEAGGTLLDFDPEKVRNHFARQYEEGKKVASELKNNGGR
ncbi:MAG: DUF697 domain-containing protein [bacterium]